MVLINMQKNLVPYQEQSSSTETNIRTMVKMTDHHYFLFREEVLGDRTPNYLIILQVRVHSEAAKNKIIH